VTQRVIVVGATSAIAQAVARRFAAEGAALVLAGRDAVKLEAVAADLRVHGAERVATIPFDAEALPDPAAWWRDAVGVLGGADAVLIAHGFLPVMEEGSLDPRAAVRSFQVNFVSAGAVALAAGDHFAREGRGCLTVIGSVAGDRGRRTNYVYGASKAGLAALVEGLRHRLEGTAVRVLLVKPGLVDTPMTASLPKGRLYTGAEAVGAGIHRAMARRAGTVYVPWYWRWIMLVIRLLPWTLFRRLRF
jgi:hypothetical protein